MGSFWSKYGECGTTTGLMILSFVLAILGIAFIYSLIGMFIGIGLIIAAWIIFIISLIMLLKILMTKKWKDNTFCKWNIAICIALLILLIAFSAAGGIEQQRQNAPANPAPSNDATSTPQTQI
jgi:amino acid transporter